MYASANIAGGPYIGCHVTNGGIIIIPPGMGWGLMLPVDISWASKLPVIMGRGSTFPLEMASGSTVMPWVDIAPGDGSLPENQ